MTLHLAEISTKVAAGRHAAVLVDQAAWHLSGHLVVPDNITILPLPAKCPELNPQENVWQFMRQTGSRTACSPVTTTLSIIAVMPGTSPSLSPGGSCHSDSAHGRMGPNHRVFVLLFCGAKSIPVCGPQALNGPIARVLVQVWAQLFMAAGRRFSRSDKRPPDRSTEWRQSHQAVPAVQR